MKAYVSAHAGLSRAMGRVASALRTYSPIEITDDEHDADLVVLHVIGYPETVAAIASIKARGKKYALIQYCLKSTQESDPRVWLPLWADEDCLCVWSYYDLVQTLKDVDVELDALDADEAADFEKKFYHAPMGVADGVFRYQRREKRYQVMTSGYVSTTENGTGGEAILEVQTAVAAVGGRMFHLGPSLPGFDMNVTTQEEGISDAYLVDILNSCRYVSGLRRREGFEMPALEGLMCGARPILFDTPDYRYWFEDHAEYVPEGTPEQVAKDVEAVLRGNYRPVTADERQAILARFNWRTVVKGFWDMATPRSSVTVAERRPRLLWVGDAVVSSGFARVTHKILDTLCVTYDVSVLGINYFGDPHSYPYDIWPSLNPLAAEADFFGVKRIAEVAERVNPDIIVIQQDPWNVPDYLKELSKAHSTVPVVGFIAVDGKNCKGTDLNGLALAIFWTEFGQREAILGGYQGLSAVVPLGVDTSIYRPLDSVVAREVMELPARMRDAFIVGNVNRNQPRKRLDLTIRYFCEWMRRYNVPDAHLFLHVAPTGDVGWDVRQLMKFYGGTGHLILAQPDAGRGVPEDILVATYASFDVQVNTAAGEGWGLTTLEGMACGVPQIVPDWAALGEWPRDAVVKIPCTSFTHTERDINVMGGVPDEKLFIEELNKLYENKHHRKTMGELAIARANDPMFNWANIGARFEKALELLKKELAVA